ncbi:hypothetical protein ACFQH6_07600 [Halobacteriaceae archaeon GCM10025711]
MSTQANTATTEIPTSQDEEKADLTKDDIFHILQVERRRAVLTYLKGHEGAVDMRDIVETVAAWENDTTVAALKSDERQRVYIALYQSHLPKLDDLGVIEYNQSRGIVERTDLASEVDPYLEVADHHDEPTTSAPAPVQNTDDEWSTYYLGAVGVATALLTGAWLELVPLADFTLGVVIVAAFMALTLGHYRDSRVE